MSFFSLFCFAVLGDKWRVCMSEQHRHDAWLIHRKVCSVLENLDNSMSTQAQCVAVPYTRRKNDGQNSRSTTTAKRSPSNNGSTENFTACNPVQICNGAGHPIPSLHQVIPLAQCHRAQHRQVARIVRQHHRRPLPEVVPRQTQTLQAQQPRHNLRENAYSRPPVQADSFQLQIL